MCCKRRRNRRRHERTQTSAVVRTRIQNNPKNINKNLLVNIDPDFTSAYAGGGVGTAPDFS